MTLKKIFILLFIFLGILKADIKSNQVLYSVWLNPPNLDDNFLVQFDLRHDIFVFEKKSSKSYDANFIIQAEFYDSNWQFVTREFMESSLSCSKFEQTISKDLYYSSHISLKLIPDTYNCRLSLLNSNSQKEIEIGSFKFNFDETNIQFPIVIKAKDLKLFNKDTTIIPFNNYLPFNSESYLLIIPIKNEILKFNLSYRDTLIDLKRRMSKGIDYYLVSLDSLPLIDGLVFIQIETANNKFNIPFKVIWLNKPMILSNMNLSLDLMGYIFDENSIKKIRALSLDKQYYAFFEAWKKLDKTPNTAYNELLDEFYKRADIAVLQYKTLNQPNGALTDRGKIFMLYGQPDKLDRKFLSNGKATEIWNYTNKFKHKFVFVDENKDGNLILKK